MTTKTKPPTNAEIASRIRQAPKPAALTAAAYAEAYAEGARIENARCEAILYSPEAKGRKALALHIACNSNMSVEDALATLRLSPEATPAPKADGGYDTGFLAAFGYGPKP